MTRPYTKPALTFTQQADLLEQRGLVIPDRPFLLRQLESVGYYRLCAYWYPFKRSDDTFEPGTSFETVWRRYRFDRQLRLAVMDGIERVEVRVRTALVYELAHRNGAFAHLNAANFRPSWATKHAEFVDKLREDAHYSSETFVDHFRATYDEFPDLPIWAAAETMTIGAVFTLYRMSLAATQKKLARSFGVSEPTFQSWLKTLHYVRNMCAHHARLWNRDMSLQPRIPTAAEDTRWHAPFQVRNLKIFGVLTVLHYLLGQVAPQSMWRSRLFDLFDEYSDVPIDQMGMVPTWRQHTLWRDHI